MMLPQGAAGILQIEGNMMLDCKGFAAADESAPLRPYDFERRDVGAQDVLVDILYCGVCHSDLHFVRNDMRYTAYPAVPGHEIVGRVAEVGSGVTRFRVGDTVGIGCMVDSCRTCSECESGLEQYCDAPVATYGGMDKYSGGQTLGGYANRIVCDEKFVVTIPEGMDLAATAPLLCAGITLYSPLRHWKAGPGKKVGIMGLGGLGHMGVKLAHAMGAHTVMFTTSPSKAADARRLGADEVVLSNDESEMARHAGTFDLIIDTISADHPIAHLFNLLTLDGTLVQLGVPEKPAEIPVLSVIMKRRSFAGSMMGSIKETQEMLDFCAANNIVSDVEVIPIQKINEAFERMLKSDVKYRFSIDMKSLG
jgi:uncharacterized zinc-type alcohol dehydrogenase-like protein